VEGGTVELLVNLAGHEPQIVVAAQPGTVADGWQAAAEIDVASSIECSCYANGQSAPNTHIEYQFRVRSTDGAVSLGPVGEITVQDDRFEWRTLEQDLVRVHWYEGDDAFAQRAADVANQAIDRAAELLGSTLPEPVDLFVYSTQDALLEALSPNRESIAGEAHSTIGTMFVWLPSNQDPNDSAVIVTHELTHLVFNETTENSYHEPPRWLNEGTAVYLSEGYSERFRGTVQFAVSTDTLIPLQGLAGFFPSPPDQFELAYGESVSAVDYIVRTYGEQTLWDLVRSYAQGLSDDDAFTTATGGDLATFNAAWMGSLGTEVPEPVGPQPAPPGPVPSDWSPDDQPSFPPGSPGPDGTAASPTPRPVGTPPASQPTSVDAGGAVLLGLSVGLIAVLAMVGVVIVVQRSRNQRPPPTTPQPPYY
jgi:hypothetical protein